MKNITVEFEEMELFPGAAYIINTPHGHIDLGVSDAGLPGHFYFTPEHNTASPFDEAKGSLPFEILNAIVEAADTLAESLPVWESDSDSVGEEADRIRAEGLPDSFDPEFTRAEISFKTGGWDIELKR